MTTTPPCWNPDGHALASAVGFGGDQTGERESWIVNRPLSVTILYENFKPLNRAYEKKFTNLPSIL